MGTGPRGPTAHGFSVSSSWCWGRGCGQSTTSEGLPRGGASTWRRAGAISSADPPGRTRAPLPCPWVVGDCQSSPPSSSFTRTKQSYFILLSGTQPCGLCFMVCIAHFVSGRWLLPFPDACHFWGRLGFSCPAPTSLRYDDNQQSALAFREFMVWFLFDPTSLGPAGPMLGPGADRPRPAAPPPSSGLGRVSWRSAAAPRLLWTQRLRE